MQCAKDHSCERSFRHSRIHLYVSLTVNNETEVDVEIHRIASGRRAAQLNRDSRRVSDPAIVGAHIDVCYVVDAVADFDHISVTDRIVPIANIEVIPCRYPSAFFLTPALTMFQGRFIEASASVLSNTEHVPVSISLPVPANPTPLPSPGPPEFVIDPELFV